MSKKQKLIHEQIAHEFSRGLLKYLGASRMGKVVARNRREREYPGCCHSHDFCDANVVMDEAFKKVTGKHASDNLNNQRTIDRWMAAWNLAKEREFKL